MDIPSICNAFPPDLKLLRIYAQTATHPTPSPPLIQHPFRTRHLSLPPHHPRSSLPQRNRQRLKRALRPMMIILAPHAIHMHRNRGALRKALQTMRQHLCAEISNLLTAQTQIYDAEGTV